MAKRLQVHVNNEQPIVIDVDELPKPTDACVIGINPRRRDGKDVEYLLKEVNQIYIPWWRINFIQVLPSEDEENIPTFIRE